MATDSKAIDFFLRGVNEPVALEIPLSRRDEENFPMIKKKLQDVGLHFGSNPNDLQFIYSGEEIAIVTPVLHPDDLRAVYDLVAMALEPTTIHPEYPYVRDLKYLPNRAKEVVVKPWSVAEEMIMNANASGEVVVFSKKSNDVTYSALAEQMNQKHHLFAGSTISDPYTTISARVNRDTRMATNAFDYAIGYACGEKKISGYHQKSNSAKRYGFLYEYEFAPGQPFFSNTGIENGWDSVYGIETINKVNETPIKRFTNPCVGRWFVWIDERDKYHMYKIPENDPQWESWLEQICAFMPNSSVQSKWIDRLEKSDKQPVSVVDGVEPGKLSEYVVGVSAKQQKRIADTKQIIANAYNEIDLILQDIAKLKQKIAKYTEQTTIKIPMPRDYDGLMARRDDINKKLQNANAYKTEMESEIRQLESRCDDLLGKIQNIDSTKESNALKTKIINLKKSNVHDVACDAEKYIESIKSITKESNDTESAIKRWIEQTRGPQMFKAVRKFTPEQRALLVKSIFEIDNPQKDQVELAVTAYDFASDEECVKLFDYFYHYVAGNNPRHIKNLKDIVKTYGDVPKEIKELSRGKSLFINHVQKAKKIIAFAKARQELENTMKTNSQRIISVAEKE